LVKGKQIIVNKLQIILILFYFEPKIQSPFVYKFGVFVYKFGVFVYKFGVFVYKSGVFVKISRKYLAADFARYNFAA